MRFGCSFRCVIWPNILQILQIVSLGGLSGRVFVTSSGSEHQPIAHCVVRIMRIWHAITALRNVLDAFVKTLTNLKRDSGSSFWSCFLGLRVWHWTGESCRASHSDFQAWKKFQSLTRVLNLLNVLRTDSVRAKNWDLKLLMKTSSTSSVCVVFERKRDFYPLWLTVFVFYSEWLFRRLFSFLNNHTSTYLS